MRMPDERLVREGWPDETLQRHHQSLSERFRHTKGEVGDAKEQLSMKNSPENL